MRPFTAIIVDDEKEARDILTSLVADHIDDVQIIAQADSADKGIELIQAENPDIVFLDIDMPGKNGFEVAKSISSHNLKSTVIFVTAFNQFAIEAIKCAAFDYLLKPIGINDLKDCIIRYKGTKRVENMQQSVNKLLNCLNAEKLPFHNRIGSIFIDPTTIVYCEAEGNYTDIYLDNGTRNTVTQSLGSIEIQLDGRGFSRINRSVIINRRFLLQINRKEKKCILIAGNKEYTLDVKNAFLRNWMN